MKTTQLQSTYETLFNKLLMTIVTLILVVSSLFGQKVEILGDANISGQLEVMDTILFSDGTTLASACLQILQDGDGDTKIEVEKVADEDIIRFTIQGVEIARFENNRLELADGGGSVFIGYKAGESDDASGNKSVYIGYETGQLSNGFANTALGANAFQNNSAGNENTSIGVSAGYQSAGSNNVFVGRDAGREAGPGADNTYLGHDAGRSATGSGNVLVGKDAGKTLIGSNKMVIDNTDSPNPFLYGDLSGNRLVLNGTQNIGQANFTIHDLDSTWGGMYINAVADGNPFYGYAQGGDVKGYHFIDSSNNWIFNKSGIAMTLNNFNYLKIGPGTPLERLDVAGAIRISNSTNNYLGTMRYQNGDFEGRTPAGWMSLTSSGTGGPDADWTIVGSDMYNNTYEVGIGITLPTAPLHVVGTSKLEGEVHVTGRIRKNTDAKTYWEWGNKRLSAYANGNRYIDIDGSTSQRTLDLGAGSDTDININDDMFLLGSSGDLAIGHTAPTHRLDIMDSGFQIKLQNPNSGGEDYFIGSSDDTWGLGGGRFAISTDGSSSGSAMVIQDKKTGFGTDSPDAKVTINSSVGEDALRVRVNGETKFRVYGDGRVYSRYELLVGTTNSATGYMASINGKVICEELRVKDSGSWPDYVFESDYDLKSLDHVKEYIEENGHLPNIPSAVEVEKEGIAVGEMQKRMMEKIEELTLYVIQLKEANDLMQEEINAIKNK